jgi:hypothetical protein
MIKRVCKKLDKIRKEVMRRELEIASHLGVEVNSYARATSSPEIMAYCFAKIGSSNALDAGALQQFQVARIDLEDMIQDNHLEKRGRKTLLNLGVQKAREVQNDLERCIEFAVANLEDSIPNARRIARQQYLDVLKYDRVRNSYRRSMPSVEKTKEIIDRVAGDFGERIACLSFPDQKLKDCGRYICRAIHTIEDLRYR